MSSLYFLLSIQFTTQRNQYSSSLTFYFEVTVGSGWRSAFTSFKLSVTPFPRSAHLWPNSRFRPQNSTLDVQAVKLVETSGFYSALSRCHRQHALSEVRKPRHSRTCLLHSIRLTLGHRDVTPVRTTNASGFVLSPIPRVFTV